MSHTVEEEKMTALKCDMNVFSKLPKNRSFVNRLNQKEKEMGLNQHYIDNLKMAEIPWSRLGTPYGSGENFPRYFEILENIEVKTKEQIKWAIEEVSSETEHQGTLWPVTPFAMIFLMRIFKESVSKMQNHELFCYLASELLDIFLIIAKSCDITKEMGHSKPLSHFSDMLKEEYLWPEDCDENEMDYDFSEDLFYSFYYYSYQILLGERDFFEGIKNFNLEGIDDILEILPKKKTELSGKAKEKFCKDCNLPIKIFKEPYFMDRLRLYDKYYGTINKWENFLKELEKYNCEQDYFEEYNRIKEQAISEIKASKGYIRFNEEDMNQYRVSHENLPNKDIFKASNHGKNFVSIDMKKANFSSLKYYDASIFSYADTWEEFIGKYTENTHIIGSKYIRQVILGNCNPKRHITYEKYLMDRVLSHLTNIVDFMNKVVFFSNDEIIIDVSDLEKTKLKVMIKQITDNISSLTIPLKIELFTLYKIEGTNGYYKEIFYEDKESEIEFKCLDSYNLPFVIRQFMEEEVTDSDKVFYFEGRLAQFL